MQEFGTVIELQGQSVVVEMEFDGRQLNAEQPAKEKVAQGDRVEVYKVGQRVIISKAPSLEEETTAKKQREKSALDEEAQALQECMNRAVDIAAQTSEKLLNSKGVGANYLFSPEDIRTMGTTLYLGVQRRNKYH